MVFPVVMGRGGCESWTIKKAEWWRINAFELWCWRGLLRVPWTSKGSNQSILKEISPQYSLEGLMLKLQYFGHLMQRTNSLEKTLMLGLKAGEEGTTEGEMVGWRHRLNGQQFEQPPGDDERQGSLRVVLHGVSKGWRWLSNWATTTRTYFRINVSKELPRLFWFLSWLSNSLFKSFI